jgi:hypothetical protein
MGNKLGMCPGLPKEWWCSSKPSNFTYPWELNFLCNLIDTLYVVFTGTSQGANDSLWWWQTNQVISVCFWSGKHICLLHFIHVLCFGGCFGHEDKVFEKRWWYLSNCGLPQLRDCGPTMRSLLEQELSWCICQVWHDNVHVWSCRLKVFCDWWRVSMLVPSIWGTPVNSQCWSLLRSVTCFVYIQSSHSCLLAAWKCIG